MIGHEEMMGIVATEAVENVALKPPYVHPKTIEDFEKVHREEYAWELESCDKWIKWCRDQNPPDLYGVNFHQGMRSAHVFNNIKMCQLLRILKREPPNV